ncbi:MAG: ABC transporter permease [Fastidiosipilaceae bacterium]|jgi:ribose/xylose/arabinose/galactoside ABC-type transport system permease subunit
MSQKEMKTKRENDLPATKKSRINIKDFGILIVFVVLVTVLSLVSKNHAFASIGNIKVVLIQTATNGILAMGMMFVILSDGIDLSVGSIIGLSGVVAASFAHPGEYPLVVSIVLALLIGAVVGAVNGVGIALGGLPPFIMTLGTMSIVRGLALIASGGSPVFNVSEGFENLSALRVGQVPIMVIYFAVVVAIATFILSKTVFGRRIYAVGGNETAATVSGINVKAIRILVYTISGFCAGMAGLLTASRTITGSPTAGEGYEMDAIAAVVIGGVSMSGGVGRPYMVVIGALLIAVIANGLDILGINANYQRVVKGVIIIFAVLMDVKGKKKRT